METENISDVGTPSRIFLVCESNMKWHVVKNFYIQMRQHLTFSIITDGFGTFIRDIMRTLVQKNQYKVFTRGTNKKDGAKTS